MAKVIELVLETDENGALHIPAELLGEARPHTRFRISAEPVEEARRHLGPLWAKVTPEEHLRDFQSWADHFKDQDSPGLSDWAVSRDSIYD